MSRIRENSQQHTAAGDGSRGAALRTILIWLSLFSWPAWLPDGMAQEAASKPAPDSGTFEIISAKNKVGTEKFQIKANETGWEATGELQLSGGGGAKTSETSALRLDGKLRRSYY